jgi:GT2 family glycosyltransferase
MTVHIFVLHYEKDEVTNACLEALLGDALVPSEDTKLFVIDNGSPVPYDTEFLSFSVIRFDENLPLIDAYNRAMQENPADAYICMANDTNPAVGMVGKLVAVLDDPHVGIVAPGTNDMGAGILWVSQPGDWSSIPTTHVDNTCWGFRQDLVDKIGWPDAEGHPHRANWYANRLYCWKARMAGYLVLAVRSAYIGHAHHGGQDAVADEAGLDWISLRLGGRVHEAL